VNAYLLKTDNFIQRGFNNNLVSFVNSGSFDRSGVELDYQRGFSNYTVFANLAYNHQDNRDDKLVAIVPKITTFLVSHIFGMKSKDMRFSLRTISKRNQARAYYLLNTNYKYKTESYSLPFTLKNLLGKKIIYPDTQDLVADHLIEGDDNVNLSVLLKYLF
jgi:hypothetical protein